MWYFKGKNQRQQRGSATSTSLMILSGVALATAGMVSLNQNLKKSRENGEQGGIDRRLNESAIQSVTQLVTNGHLFYNQACGRLEPAKSSTTDNTYSGLSGNGCGDIQHSNRGITLTCDNPGANTQWLYVWNKATKLPEVHVCTKASDKNGKAVDRVLKKVVVKVTGYDTPPEQQPRRTYLLVSSKPDGRNDRGAFYGSLNGRISLGLTEGNSGLVGKHAAADTCFYMRPKTIQQARGGANNLSFAARSSTQKYQKYTLAELEPRPDGPNADEFQQAVDLGTAAPEGYELLTDLLTGTSGVLKDYYKKDLRGNRPESGGWIVGNPNAWTPGGGRPFYKADVITKQDFLQHSGKQFIGVMPNVPNGPQFQYFLSTVPGTSNHIQGWKTFDASNAAYYQRGCATSAGDGNATFCTRVDIPLKSYKAAVKNKCRLINNRTLQSSDYDKPPLVAYSDRAIQTSCSDAWIATVEKLVAQEQAARAEYERTHPFDQRKEQPETTATMVISALEADDEFIKGEGKWAGHPLRVAYTNFASELVKQGNMRVVDDYTIEYLGAQDQRIEEKKLDKDGNEVITYKDVKGEDRKWSVYSIETLPQAAVEEKHHVAKSCAYFKYYNPESPKGCSIAFATRNDSGYVCRNNDGCFDELTKIRMADGTDRLVTQLKMGEFVYNPVTGKPSKITKLTIGPELKPLLNVTIGNSTVRVTDSHPFMTKRGWMTAKQLREGDEVLSGDKQFRSVRKVTLGESGRTVANLALEGPADRPELHYVLADGVVTGDLVIQNLLQAQAALEMKNGR